MKQLCLFAALAICFAQLFGQGSLEERITTVFPAATITQQENTALSYGDNYQPSGSSWSIGFEESHVYRCLLDYNHPLNPDHSYEMRIGKGGQIYSLKGSFGESIPPQWRNPGGAYGGDYAPWVDEVWQLVAVAPGLNDPANNRKYFIHGAGVYLKDPMNLTQPFYSVELASFYDAAEQEYSTVNWGQQAHVDQNLTAGFTSSLLYYSNFKNLGNGIIQVDYLVYNFGLDTIGHMNVPWGGVRRSNMDHWFVSDIQNGYQEYEGTFGAGTIFNTDETNGWVAFSSDANGDAPSLAIVVNNDAGVLRIGDAGSTSDRDYTVYSAIRNGFDLTFGQSLRIRNYFILGSTVNTIQTKVASLDLQSKTFFDFEAKLKSEVDAASFFFAENGSQILAEETTDANALHLKLQAYENSVPLFIIKGVNSSGVERSRITSNPYSFSGLPYDGNLLEMKLIGFSDSKKALVLENVSVPYNGSYTFPDGYTMHNITEDLKYIALNTVSTNGFEQYVQTNITVELSSNGYYLWYENNTRVENIIANNAVRGIFEANVANPDFSNNTNAIVAKFTKTTDEIYPFADFMLPNPIKCCLSCLKIQFKAYLNDTLIPFGATDSNQRIRVILRNSTQSTNGQLVKVVYFAAGETWETMTIDFSGSALPQNIIAAGGYDQVVLYFDNTSTTRATEYFIDTFKGSIFQSPVPLSACSGEPKVWDGIAWTPAGPPDLKNAVILSGDYNTAIHGNLNVCGVEIQHGAKLIVPPNTCFQSKNELLMLDGVELSVEQGGCFLIRGGH